MLRKPDVFFGFLTGKGVDNRKISFVEDLSVRADT